MMMLAQLWGGVFDTSPLKIFEEFNQSLPFDQALWAFDILGSIAHVTMLGKQGYLTEDETSMLVEGLQTLYQELEAGTTVMDMACEDIHSFVEKTLTDRLGTAGKKIHMGRSRNDQVALDMKLYTRAKISQLHTQVVALISALCHKAQQHTHTIMPGFTHLQVAQPITFGHHLMAYTEMFLRDKSRLQDCLVRLNTSPLGAGALATSTFNLDRHFVAEQLGFADVTYNSLDTVSDRDYLLELLSDLSIMMMHLSRLSDELILWNSQAFNFVVLEKTLCTGSSMMPQKQNPDAAELIRGKTGRVYGALISLLTTMKALPLAYNKDMQEDKEPVFDAIKQVSGCVEMMTAMINGLQANVPAMRKLCEQGFIAATDVADYLVTKGVPFRESHELVGQLIRQCQAQNTTLEALNLETLQQFSPLFSADFFEAIALETCVNVRCVVGGPAPVQVQARIDAVLALLG
jgi:argininosuccinate lyase